jgi:hypothetical protein
MQMNTSQIARLIERAEHAHQEYSLMPTCAVITEALESIERDIRVLKKALAFAFFLRRHGGCSALAPHARGCLASLKGRRFSLGAIGMALTYNKN